MISFVFFVSLVVRNFLPQRTQRARFEKQENEYQISIALLIVFLE